MATPILQDGTVVSSAFTTSNNEGQLSSRFRAQYMNYGLRVGYVKAHHPPSSSENLSKLYHEYDVVAAHMGDSTHVYSTTEYRNCVVMEMFGSGADYSYYTLRPSEHSEEEVSKKPVLAGSLVFLLCENGNGAKAYIVGSPAHPAKGRQREGHVREWEFNGCKFTVEDDGSVSLQVRGPTNIDGTVKEKSDIGSNILIDANGGITISTKSGQSILVRDGTINLLSKNTIRLLGKKAEIGDKNLAPALRVTPNYEASLKAMHSALEVFIDSVNALGQAGAAAPALSGALVAPAAAVQVAAQALKQTISQHSNSISKGDAIATKLDVE